MTERGGAAGPRAVIDLEALRANVRQLLERAPGRACIAVVKADAYGHGVVPTAREVLAAGADALAVVTASEAREVRSAGVDAPLLVLAGPRDAAEADAVLVDRAVAVLHHEEGARRMAESARRRGEPARVQLEVDTGMRRMGVAEADAEAFAQRVAADEWLELEGVFTHFACADAEDAESSVDQCRRFQRVLSGLRARGLSGLQVHAANSAGVLSPEILAALPEATAIRPGLALYGVQPAPHLGRGLLQPVMSLRAPVVQLHSVRAGEGVGYGASWTAAADTRVATLGVGYADGVAWNASSRGAVWLAGAQRPIVGRVSMDSVGVEVGAAPVALGEEAVVFGASPAEGDALRVEAVSERWGTLSYELLVRVGQRVRREAIGQRV